MSYFNSKEVIISSSIGYLQYRIEVIPVDIGEAVRARILVYAVSAIYLSISCAF